MEIIDYKGYRIKIQQDSDIESPRTFHDNLGTMLCRHRKYNLGDEKESKEFPWDNFNSWEEVKEYLIKKYDIAVILPVYMYDHSGIILSTEPFTCNFDSGQVGWIYVEKKAVRQCLSVKKITDLAKENAKELLVYEVNTFSQYVEGDVWYYTIEDPNGKEIDSCCGLYGYDYAVETCKKIVDNDPPQSIKFILED